MNSLTRSLVVVASTLAVAAPVGLASAAQAHPNAGRTWTTIEVLGKGKQEACKVSANGGNAWKIYNRLDSRKAGGKLEATLTVTKKSKPTSRTWDSGYVKAGHISAVGTVLLPRTGTGFGLLMTIHGENFGNGGIVKIATIKHC